MRLICPNCDAQYEVSDDAIPAEGRDVQCSNCGHGWFCLPGRSAMPPLAAVPEDEDDDEDGGTVVGADPAEPVVPPSRNLDQGLLAVLREEAEREARQRRREGAPEAVPDPGPAGTAEQPRAEGVPEAGPDRGEAGAAEQRRPESTPESTPESAPARGEAEDPAGADTIDAAKPLAPAPRPTPAAAAAAAAIVAGLSAPRARLEPIPEPLPEPDPVPRPRRDLLPDIEEINSTLRPDQNDLAERPHPAGAPVPQPSRAAYRSGFFLMLALAFGLGTLYVMAPRLAQEMPGAEPALRSYVAAADEARLLLDRILRSAVDRLHSAGN